LYAALSVFSSRCFAQAANAAAIMITTNFLMPCMLMRGDGLPPPSQVRISLALWTSITSKHHDHCIAPGFPDATKRES
jgi:hypothetical protein